MKSILLLFTLLCAALAAQTISTPSSGTTKWAGKWTLNMPEFARDLTVQVGRPVLDRTGIQGRFDIELPSFLPPDLELGARIAGDGRAPLPPPNTPSISSVLEDQLGLRLESTHAPIEIYVVDHLERPSEN